MKLITGYSNKIKQPHNTVNQKKTLSSYIFPYFGTFKKNQLKSR